MFLISTLVPNAVLSHRPERDVGVAAERPLLHPDVAHVERLQRRAELAQVRGGLLGRAHVGFAHALHQRHARAVVVDQRVVGLVDPARRAAVRRLARVLLHVHARDADPPRLAVDVDVQVPADADRQVVLADLEVLRHVGIEVVLPVEQRVRRDRAVEREPDLDDRRDRLGVGDRQRARMAQADRTDVGVGLVAERVAAAAEHLRARGELDVALQPDDGLQLGHDEGQLIEDRPRGFHDRHLSSGHARPRPHRLVRARGAHVADLGGDGCGVRHLEHDVPRDQGGERDAADPARDRRSGSWWRERCSTRSRSGGAIGSATGRPAELAGGDDRGRAAVHLRQRRRGVGGADDPERPRLARDRDGPALDGRDRPDRVPPPPAAAGGRWSGARVRGAAILVQGRSRGTWTPPGCSSSSERRSHGRAAVARNGAPPRSSASCCRAGTPSSSGREQGTPTGIVSLIIALSRSGSRSSTGWSSTAPPLGWRVIAGLVGGLAGTASSSAAPRREGDRSAGCSSRSPRRSAGRAGPSTRKPRCRRRRSSQRHGAAHRRRA